MGWIRNGHYETQNGSHLEISGQSGGIARLDFDWFEEGACPDCAANPYPEGDGDEWCVVWTCDHCGGGQSLLYPAPQSKETA